MIDKIKGEPVVTGILAFVAATIALLVAFHVHVTADQREAIEGWVAAAVALAAVIRSAVTPTGKAEPPEKTVAGIVAEVLAQIAPKPDPDPPAPVSVLTPVNPAPAPPDPGAPAA